VYTTIHRALVNSLTPAPWVGGGFDCASASSDGTVKLFDLDTGVTGARLTVTGHFGRSKTAACLCKVCSARRTLNACAHTS
jgi:WD40 repeat protein